MFDIAAKFNDHLKKIEAAKEINITKIESIIRFHISMMITEYESVYISDHEWKHLPEPFLSEFKNMRKAYQQRLAAIIQKGIDKKEIRKIDANVAVLQYYPQ